MGAAVGTTIGRGCGVLLQLSTDPPEIAVITRQVIQPQSLQKHILESPSRRFQRPHDDARFTHRRPDIVEPATFLRRHKQRRGIGPRGLDAPVPQQCRAGVERTCCLEPQLWRDRPRQLLERALEPHPPGGEHDHTVADRLHVV